MSSRDFGYLTLRTAVAYAPDGNFVPPDYLMTVSTYGQTVWSNSLALSSLSLSSLKSANAAIDTLSVSSLTASTINLDLISLSSFAASTAQIANLDVSTLNASTINLSIVTLSSFAASTATLGNLDVSTLNASTVNLSIISLSSFTASTANIDTLSVSSLIVSTAQIQTLYNSTFLGSSIKTREFGTSTLIASTGNISVLTNNLFNGSTILGRSVTTSTLVASSLTTSSLTTSSLTTSSLTTSSLVASTAQIQTLYNSTFLGSSITTMEFGTSTLIASTGNIGILTNNLFNGSTILVSSLTASTAQIGVLTTSSSLASTSNISTLVVSTINGLPYISGNDVYWVSSGVNNIRNANLGYNVGINNINPQYTLDVSGNINTQGTFTLSTTNGGALRFTGAAGTSFIESGLNLSTSSANLLKFTNINATPGTSALSLDLVNYRAGFGTDTPAFPVDVVGGIHTNTFVSSQTVLTSAVSSNTLSTGLGYFNALNANVLSTGTGYFNALNANVLSTGTGYFNALNANTISTGLVNGQYFGRPVVSSFYVPGSNAFTTRTFISSPNTPQTYFYKTTDESLANIVLTFIYNDWPPISSAIQENLFTAYNCNTIGTQVYFIHLYSSNTFKYDFSNLFEGSASDVALDPGQYISYSLFNNTVISTVGKNSITSLSPIARIAYTGGGGGFVSNLPA